jgi:hypothetical protein
VAARIVRQLLNEGTTNAKLTQKRIFLLFPDRAAGVREERKNKITRMEWATQELEPWQ